MNIKILLFCTSLLFLSSCASSIIEKKHGKRNDFSTVDFFEIKKYADFSYLSYKRKSKLRKKYGKENVKVINTLINGQRAFLVTDDFQKKQIVVIRGTKNLRNLYFLDLKAQKFFDNKINTVLHKGFHKATISLYKKIQPHLNKQYDISFTGHSLGGAVAAIMSLHAHQDGYNIGDVITFGQPKITTKRYIKHMNDSSDILRVVNAKDLIPLLPLMTNKSDAKGIVEDIKENNLFWHFGPEVILHKKHMSYLESHDAERIGNNSLLLNIMSARLSKHKMKKYIKYVNSIIDRNQNSFITDFHSYMSAY